MASISRQTTPKQFFKTDMNRMGTFMFGFYFHNQDHDRLQAQGLHRLRNVELIFCEAVIYNVYSFIAFEKDVPRVVVVVLNF